MRAGATLGARLARAWARRVEEGPGALAAAGAGYRGVLGLRDWLYARGVLRCRRVPCPVIAVGNLTVGGTGKTPATALAARTLAGLGRRPVVVSRGYGRRSRGVQVVADTVAIRLDPREAGDEPFLLARRLPGVPVVVGASRYEAARAAVERFGATAIVLDDGFQHRTLAKDLEVVMVRARRPWGNGRLLPAGPLREPLSALARADLVVVLGAAHPAEAGEVADAVRRWAPSVPLLGARYEVVECWRAGGMEPIARGALAGRRLLAFAGIAWPAAFAATLEEIGVAPAGLQTFRDHHWYTAADLVALDARAGAIGADGLVTTEKDWVRLARLAPPRRPLYVVGVALTLTWGEAIWREALARACSVA